MCILDKDAFVQSAHLGSMPADVTQLSLLTGVGLSWHESGSNQK